MNARGDVFEIFFYALIGIIMLIAFIPIYNDLVGTATTNLNNATSLTYTIFSTTIIGMVGILAVIMFVRGWWKSSAPIGR